MNIIKFSEKPKIVLIQGSPRVENNCPDFESKTSKIVDYIVKKYKELGGKYADDDHTKNLKRWFKEKWQDVGHKSYPVYRTTVRINKHTPLTVNEIDKKDLKEQIKRKQIIKGNKNLPPFKSKFA